MKRNDEETGFGEGALSPVVFEISGDFQLEVLEKLGMVEAKVDMIVGNGQPGRLRLVEERVAALEKNDIRRNVYDRIVTAAIAFAVSAVIALHDHLGLR
ncbi:MAG: hypothetical protein LAO56_22265 [Acidobacteriia bacterium]|jgi:hypothetical protein|nr:hypothetical protein [Terriglobia bacterium]